MGSAPLELWLHPRFINLSPRQSQTCKPTKHQWWNTTRTHNQQGFPDLDLSNMVNHNNAIAICRISQITHRWWDQNSWFGPFGWCNGATPCLLVQSQCFLVKSAGFLVQSCSIPSILCCFNHIVCSLKPHLKTVLWLVKPCQIQFYVDPMRLPMRCRVVKNTHTIHTHFYAA